MNQYIKVVYRKYISSFLAKKWANSLLLEKPVVQNLVAWKAKCKGDTFFVLGSGSSINNITKQEWQNISENTSIGLNYWCIHDFIPTFYLAEIPAGERAEVWTKIINDRIIEYQSASVSLNIKVPYTVSRNTQLKLRVLEGLDDRAKRLVRLIPSYPIYTSNKESTLKSIDDYLKKAKKLDAFSHLVQIRGSIIGAYLLGAVLGFKKIVFYGVDLGDTKYFYSENATYYKGINRPIPATGYAPNQPHGNIKKIDGALDIIELLELISTFLAREYQIDTFNANPKSKLATVLPLYEL